MQQVVAVAAFKGIGAGTAMGIVITRAAEVTGPRAHVSSVPAAMPFTDRRLQRSGGCLAAPPAVQRGGAPGCVAVIGP